MEIAVSQAQARVPVTVVHLKGNLDSSSYEQFEKQIKELIQGGAKNILLDMGQVPYMSSAGMRSLTNIVNLLHTPEEVKNLRKAAMENTAHSPHLKVVEVTKNVMSVLQMSGMDMFLDIRKNQKEGLAAF